MSEEIFYKKTINNNMRQKDIENGLSFVEETWYKLVNNRVVLHNEEGPAYVSVYVDENGGEFIATKYKVNGEFHREDGPAIISGTGSQEYFYKGHSFDQLQLLAHAKGVTAESWSELVNFAKREHI